MVSLLARLRASSALAGAASEAALREDVLRHLQRMCCTRRGSMRTRPDYGLPDVGEMVHSFPDALTELGDALRHTITRYEPRLANVAVKHVPSEALSLIVRFEVQARLRIGPRSAPVRFETLVDSAKIRVR